VADVVDGRGVGTGFEGLTLAGIVSDGGGILPFTAPLLLLPLLDMDPDRPPVVPEPAPKVCPSDRGTGAGMDEGVRAESDALTPPPAAPKGFTDTPPPPVVLLLLLLLALVAATGRGRAVELEPNPAREFKPPNEIDARFR
jgi:hypothetical protein